jgi:HK97 gp10 family phage protein
MRVKGVSAVIAELRGKSKELDKIIQAETKNAAFKIEKDAKTYAPKNFGKLAQSISNSKSGELNYKVTVNEKYGAYLEFGTGAKVKVPTDFQDIANSFKGKKSGTFEEGLKSIQAWCRSKGIDEKYAKWIFIKILGAGINPQPFLYPAWVKGQKEYLEQLNKLVKKFK